MTLERVVDAVRSMAASAPVADPERVAVRETPPA
jgi:hypothetical protein